MICERKIHIAFVARLQWIPVDVSCRVCRVVAFLKLRLTLAVYAVPRDCSEADQVKRWRHFEPFRLHHGETGPLLRRIGRKNAVHE